MKALATACQAVAVMALMLPAACEVHAAPEMHRCATRAEMLATLNERYHERPRDWHLIGPALVLEYLVSDRGTWTVLATTPGGNTCIVHAGRGHIVIQLPVPAPPMACGTREAVAGHLESRGLMPSDPVEFFDENGEPIGFVQEYADGTKFTVVHGRRFAEGWHVCFGLIRKGLNGDPA